MDSLILRLIILAAVILILSLRGSRGNRKRRHDNSKDEDFISDELMRMLKSRGDYYRDVYLKSNAWKRKRYVVLKRDNFAVFGSHCNSVLRQHSLSNLQLLRILLR